MNYCPKCGNPLLANQNFCSHCGTSITQQSTQQTHNHQQQNWQAQSQQSFEQPQYNQQSQFYENTNPLFEILEQQNLKKIVIIGIVAGIVIGLLSAVATGGNMILPAIIGGILNTAIHISIVSKAALQKKNMLCWIIVGGLIAGTLGVLALGGEKSGLGSIFFCIAYAIMLFSQGGCKDVYRKGCLFVCIGLGVGIIASFGIGILSLGSSIITIIGFIMLINIKEEIQ